MQFDGGAFDGGATSRDYNGDMRQRSSGDSGNNGGQGQPGAGGEQDIDLLYDPILSCYFDPKTGKYYELKNG